MSESKQSVRQIQLAFALSLVSLGCMPVYAQLNQPTILVQQPASTINPAGRLHSQLSDPVFNEKQPPKGIGEPGSRVGGGRRGECQLTEKQLSSSEDKLLTALVPMYSGSDLVLGYTTNERPTFWFYVPEAAPFSAEFVLAVVEKDSQKPEEEERIIYQTPIQLSATPGVVSISLPSTVPPLEVGERYHWYFSVNCGQDTTAFVHGWVTRDLLDQALKSELEKASLKQRVALYAENGFWYEALTASAELRRTEPNSNDWKTLLKAVSLENVASEPLLECCKPER